MLSGSCEHSPRLVNQFRQISVPTALHGRPRCPLPRLARPLHSLHKRPGRHGDSDGGEACDRRQAPRHGWSSRGPDAGSHVRSAVGSRELGAALGWKGRRWPEQDRRRGIGRPPRWSEQRQKAGASLQAARWGRRTGKVGKLDQLRPEIELEDRESREQISREGKAEWSLGSCEETRRREGIERPS
jgi:hypothetical protein